jgi:hypothetical protein
MSCPPCNNNCEQGDCMGSVNASRRALGLPPLHRDALHTEEGGETVDTEPLPSLIKGLAIFIGFALAAITAVALIAS